MAMSTEKTVFHTEVSEIERWWKVCFNFVFFSMTLTLVTPFIEPSLRQGEATIHSRRRRLEAWDTHDIISRQYPSQEGIRAFFRAF